nr:immunoglobulin heavy chain junction region [Macaca mulatta]MOV91886.1 immunoglobulin heavy chain junction region [Macaca mulatta]
CARDDGDTNIIFLVDIRPANNRLDVW